MWRWTWLLVVAVAACGGDATGLASARPEQLPDPVGDTLPGSGSARAPDVSGMVAEVSGDSLTLTLGFAAPVLETTVQNPNGLAGILEIDADADPSTGYAPFTASYTSHANVGVEYSILIPGAADGTVDVYDIGARTATAYPATYTATSLTLRIPLSAIGRPRGAFKLVGVVGTTQRPTDVLPNTGAYSILQ